LIVVAGFLAFLPFFIERFFSWHKKTK
jgi:hypothetical protein